MFGVIDVAHGPQKGNQQEGHRSLPDHHHRRSTNVDKANARHTTRQQLTHYQQHVRTWKGWKGELSLSASRR